MIEVSILDKEKRELNQGDIILFKSENPYIVISRTSATGLEYNLVNLTNGKLGNSIWYSNIKDITTDYYDISKIYRGDDEVKLILGK